MKRVDESVSGGETVLDPSGRGPARVSGAPPAGPADLTVDHSDRYKLGGTEAAGGIGRVVRAQDRRLHRTVAVKELLERTPSAEARFVREALITARLEHPGVVPIYDAARWPSGEPYYSMKLVSGRTLKELIEARPTLDARLALVPNVLAVAEAVAYAHSRQVIHRDLKPANVIVGDFGETVVIDWGLAKDLSGRVAEPEAGPVDPTGATLDSTSGSGGAVTVAGNVMGTPSYMAPEQARGDEVDARADVYALGAILYEVLSGQPPHAGRSNQEILARAVIGEVRPLDPKLAISPDLAAIVAKALARDVADRYPDAAPLADDLRRFQTGQLVSARQYGTGTLVRRWIARHRAVVALAAVFTAALAVTGAVALRRIMAERDVAQRERALAQALGTAAEQRTYELVYRQAAGSLERDPTAALAALKVYPPTGARADQLPALVDEALAAGVASHVLRGGAWVHQVAITARGELIVLDHDSAVSRWTLAGGVARGPTPLVDGGAIRLSPDGAWVVLRDRTGALQLAGVATSTQYALEGEGGEAGCQFSADSRRLLTVDAADTVRAWDVATGRKLLTLTDVASSTIGGDGATVAWRDKAGAVRVAPIDGGPARVVTHAGHLVLIALSPGDGTLLLQEHGRAPRLVTLASGKSTAVAGATAVETVAFSERGDRVAFGRRDGTVSLVRLADGAELAVLHGHEDTVLRVAFIRDDSILVSTSDDATARLWYLDTGQWRVLRGHRDDIEALAVAPDERSIVTGSLDASVRVWPLDQPGVQVRRVAKLDNPGTVGMTADGRWFLSYGEADGLRWYERGTGKATLFRESGWAWSPANGYSHDLLALAGPQGIGLWSPVTGALRVLPRVHDKPAVGVAIDDDARHLVSIGEDGAVVRWDVASGQGRVVRRGDIPLAVTLMPGGRQFVVCGKGWLELWDAEAGTLVRAADMTAFPQLCSQIAPSRDGTAVLLMSVFSPVGLLWRVAGSAVRPIDLGQLNATALSPDGARVAVGLMDRSVAMVDAATGRATRLGTHADMIFQMSFSPDGRTFASASNDRTVRLWDVATGRSRALHGSRAFGAVGYSPDGGSLSAATLDGVVFTWTLADLPHDAPEDTPARLRAATSAVIDADGDPTTPPGAAP